MAKHRKRKFLEFNRTFLRYALDVWETLLGLVVLVMAGGVCVARLEDLPIGDGIYFAFITAFSIGYGDIVPKTGLGRVLSVGIGFAGLIFIGLTVAVATRALADTRRHDHEHPTHK